MPPGVSNKSMVAAYRPSNPTLSLQINTVLKFYINESVSFFILIFSTMTIKHSIVDNFVGYHS